MWRTVEDDEEQDDMLRIQFELNQELRKMVGRLRETKNIPIVGNTPFFERRVTSLSAAGDELVVIFTRAWLWRLSCG